MTDARPGPDGRLRCPWALSTADYVDYHDLEWGRPIDAAGDPATLAAGIYERLTLEAFQSGLSWLTILRKRQAFRTAFAGFDPSRVAEFTDEDVSRLMADSGIVRNRLKIDAAIANARVIADWGSGFAETVLSYAEPDRPRPERLADVPASTPASAAMAKRLKSHGVRFVGPTTAYALMQALGLVDDHLADCWVPRREPDRVVGNSGRASTE